MKAQKQNQNGNKNKLKTLALMVAALGIFHASPSQAVPVMNDNASVSRNTTIFPDHLDANVFYIAPNYISLCMDQAGVPRFSYIDYASSWGTHGIVQTTLCARYHEEDLDAAKKAILAKAPNARFVALPFTQSKVVFDPVYEPLIVKQFCDHTAGMVGDEQSCSFRLNRQGRAVFLKQVHDRVSMTMQYEYHVAGFIRKPEGGFQSQDTTYSIAIRFGGEELKSHPELFLDTSGRPVKSK